VEIAQARRLPYLRSTSMDRLRVMRLGHKSIRAVILLLELKSKGSAIYGI
jgi:hypothetical protein